MSSAKASSRAWNSKKPTAGSTLILTKASGRDSASSSISTPPSRDPTTITRSLARSMTMPK